MHLLRLIAFVVTAWAIISVPVGLTLGWLIRRLGDSPMPAEDTPPVAPSGNVVVFPWRRMAN